MIDKFMMLIATALVVSAVACGGHVSHAGNTANSLAANVVDAAVEALAKDDGGPKWDELDRRLGTLLDNNTREGDEAVVILMSFYLGEHEGEEVEENLISRGPRMIPLIERYLREEPSSLLNKYPRRVRLERATTVEFLKEDLEILRVQAGARRIDSVTLETAPLQNQAGNCTVSLVHQPKFDFGNNLIQPGESYSGRPVLRADIDESGNVTHAELLSSSGLRRLDTQALAGVNKLKYAARPHCGVIQVNIVLTIDWMPPEAAPTRQLNGTRPD